MEKFAAVFKKVQKINKAIIGRSPFTDDRSCILTDILQICYI